MNQRSKILAATAATLLGGLLVANTAGAAGTPWYCVVTNTAQACRVVQIGRDIDRKADAAVDAAGTTVEAGEQGGRAVVNGVELAGTLAGKTADALAWANDQAGAIPVPARTLRPGECVTLAGGRRVCVPVSSSTPAGRPTGAAAVVPVGTCVLDSNGRRWCVTS